MFFIKEYTLLYILHTFKHLVCVYMYFRICQSVSRYPSEIKVRNRGTSVLQQHVIRYMGGMNVTLHTFLTMGLNCEKSASCSCLFNPIKKKFFTFNNCKNKSHFLVKVNYLQTKCRDKLHFLIKISCMGISMLW